MNLNLEQLKTYALVVESGSFSGAADRLGISQPAVSLQIKELERRLGVKLLERVARKATPTAAGLDLMAHIARLQLAVDDVFSSMAGHSTTVSGRVSIGCGATVCLYFLPALLGALRARFPALSVTVITGNTSEIVKAVENNTLDAALVTLPVKSRALDCTPLLEDEFVAIAPKNGPAMRRVTPQLMAGKPLILFEPGANTRVLADQWLREAGLTVQPVMELGSIEATKAMVAAGLGWSIVPAMAVSGAGEHAGLAVSPLHPRLYRSLAVVLRRDKPVNKALRQVLLAMQERAAQFAS
jgi:DNA-binding transcriptional LysR family regulator